MQGLKRRKAGGHGSHQARSTSFKIEPTPQIDLTGQETLGNIKADPEENRLQPAQDIAEDISSSKPAAGSRRNSSRFVAAAGIAKCIRSEAEDALVKDPCRLAAETGTAKRIKSDAEDAPVAAPCMSAAAAGTAKRIKGEAEYAPVEYPAKLSRTKQAPHYSADSSKAAHAAKQQECSGGRWSYLYRCEAACCIKAQWQAGASGAAAGARCAGQPCRPRR